MLFEFSPASKDGIDFDGLVDLLHEENDCQYTSLLLPEAKKDLFISKRAKIRSNRPTCEISGGH